MSNPHVSIIVTVYNEERYLAEAIESVLNQNYDDVEVIVVDDGSTDRSAEIARGFDGVDVIERKNGGAAAAMNTGLARAKGELLAFLDSDDVWVPDTLGNRVALFDDDLSLDMTHGMVVEFISPELDTRKYDPGRNLHSAIQARLCGSTMMRRSAYERVGPTDERLRVGFWMEWLMRASDLGIRTKNDPSLVLRRRLHDSNLGLREKSSRGDYVKLLKDALDRRRGSPNAS